MPQKIVPQERIDEISEILGIDQAEVLKMLVDDERIEQGEKLFELTEEQAKASKKARQVSRAPSTEPTKRERKADNDKREIIQAIDEVLCDISDDVIITNEERQIDFVFNDRKFRIVLSAPRS